MYMFLFKSDRGAINLKVSMNHWRQPLCHVFSHKGTSGHLGIRLGVFFRKGNDHGLTKGRSFQKTPSEVILSKGEWVSGFSWFCEHGRAAPVARESLPISLKGDVGSHWYVLKWWKAEWIRVRSDARLCETSLSAIPPFCVMTGFQGPFRRETGRPNNRY